MNETKAKFNHCLNCFAQDGFYPRSFITDCPAEKMIGLDKYR